MLCTYSGCLRLSLWVGNYLGENLSHTRTAIQEPFTGFECTYLFYVLCCFQFSQKMFPLESFASL